jgi:hypothetical protein
MNRRTFLAGTGAVLAAAALVAAVLNTVLAPSLFAAPYALAQPGRTYRVAMLEPFSTEEGLPYRETFLAAMRELGYVEGRNLTGVRATVTGGSSLP